MQALTRPRLLLVDDEPHILSALTRSLRHSLRQRFDDVVLETQSDPLQALRRAAEQPFDLILSDYRMPGLLGVELLVRIRGLQPQAGRLILSGQVDHDGLVAAINEACIDAFLAKPWNDELLAEVVARTLMTVSARRETERLADQMRARRGEITPQELERRRLELLEPGITHAEWDSDGSLLMEVPL
ncbi:response regulator [Pelomonas sp. CA6]|uniref:response regulator n=1 Tax=Pelomonas sp. CA6 TaxID=2907999 RepID=UPI001F4C19A4|nr:response regulator [Pelomonas sp. CA6]MCH7343404.1 response regulator [Pelomonas sp. CA6]